MNRRAASLAVAALAAALAAAAPALAQRTNTRPAPQKSAPAKKPAAPAKAAPAKATPAAPAESPVSSGPTAEQIYAQQKACEARKPPRKSKGTITEGTYKRLERIIEAIAKNEYAESEAKLKEMLAGGRGEYEKAIVLQTLGFVYASQNKMQQAIKTFEEALAQNALPQQPHEQMMFNIAQLHIAEDRWDEGMRVLNDYMKESCNPMPDAHVLLATVYADKKRWRDSLQQVDLALAKAKTPKEPWLQLKLALHYELKEMPKCAEVLLRLVALVPSKEDYWKQWSGILFEVKKDPESLAVLSLAERKGFITDEREHLNLSNLYMYLGIPFKAATVLQRGVDEKVVAPTEKHLELLANAWLLAREYKKAEVAMKGAAEASDKGELYKRLGAIQIEDGNYKGALASLTKAEQKGGLKEPGELHFLIGVAAVELKDWKRADAALRKAMGFDKTNKVAAEWLNHLQAEYAFHNPEPVAEPESETN